MTGMMTGAMTANMTVGSMTGNMTWADFYLICFAVGFLLSAISFIAGGLRWHLHLPHFPHAAAGHIGAGHAPVTHAGVGKGAAHTGRGEAISFFNFVTLTAFLAWFGGTGFLITRFSSIWYALGLVVSLGAGLFGAGIVFLFLSRVLISRDENMDAADYEMVGVLGRISMPIREQGTGEIIYSQAGTRRTCGARSENGAALAKGAEIIVTRYDKGIAYVRRWEEMNGDEEKLGV
jgi:membrane protein implicated in regulation of membrane protease activity